MDFDVLNICENEDEHRETKTLSRKKKRKGLKKMKKFMFSKYF